MIAQRTPGEGVRFFFFNGLDDEQMRSNPSRRRSWHIAICITITSLSQLEPGEAQEPPRFFLNANGPTEEVRALEFSSNSQRLYAAGFDKVVHVWDVGWNGGRNEPDRATYVDTLRWEFARGHRGVIQGLAVCRTHDEVAIGGLSARQQNGDIAVFNTALGVVKTSLPTVRDKNFLPGHVDDVEDLDYSPNGNRIASISRRGEVIIWTRDGVNWIPVVIEPGNAATVLPARVLFLTDESCVFSKLTNAGWRLGVYNLRMRTTALLPEDYGRGVMALSRLDGVHWASADSKGIISVRSVEDTRRLLYEFNSGVSAKDQASQVADMSLGPRGTLAIAANTWPDMTQGFVELWQLNNREATLLDQVVVSRTTPCRAVAISPDGRRVATHDADSGAVVIFKLVDQRGQSLLKPFADPPTIVRGRGRSVSTVAFSATNNKLIALGPSTQLTKAIDLRTGEIRETSLVDRWYLNDEKFPDWQVQPIDEAGTVLQVTFRGQLQGTIQLDANFQGRFSGAFCVVPDQDGRAVALALGIANNLNINVYSLPTPDQPPRFLRAFSDHYGSVTTLRTSADGRFLISGARDQTVKIWNLERLFAGNVNGTKSAFPVAAWGASFSIEGGRVVARNVDPAGIAFAKGLRDGTEVSLVIGYQPRRDDVQVAAEQTRDGAPVILHTLERLSVLREVYLECKGAKIFFRPAWEPLLSVFVDANDDWAVWHPAGYFNASPAEGGELFGWQINQGQNVQPQLMKADFLQKEFEKPEVIDQLLTRGNLRDALAAANLPQQELEQVAAQAPVVTLLAPEASSTWRSVGNVVQAEIDFKAAERPKGMEVVASVNGKLLGDPRVTPVAGTSQRFEWIAPSQGELNRVEVLATESKGAMNSLYGNDVVHARGLPLDKPYMLHIISLACEKYGGPNGNAGDFPRLEFSVQDSTAIISKFTTKAELQLGSYVLGEFVELLDNEVSNDKVIGAISKVSQRCNLPDYEHVIVVYLSGHGFSHQGSYYFVPSTVTSAKQAALEQKAIRWDTLKLAALSGCRVYWVIDTCHSGVAMENVKSAIREPKRNQGLVIAAATGTEGAHANGILGHGFFTYYLLKGLDGAADGAVDDGADDTAKRAVNTPDHLVTVQELVTYVRSAVPSLAKSLKIKQRPCATPTGLLELSSLPLTKVPK